MIARTTVCALAVLVGSSAALATPTFEVTTDTTANFGVSWSGWNASQALEQGALGVNWSFTLRIVAASIPDPNNPGGTIAGWTVAYNFAHLVAPHGEPLNIVHVPVSPNGPYFFADSYYGTISHPTINSGSAAHAGHSDNWTFHLDRSPGNGYSGNFAVTHIPTPSAAVALCVTGVIAARRRRR
jgi:hypothetical protein